MTEKRQKKADFKKHKARIHSYPYLTTLNVVSCDLDQGLHPRYPNSKSKSKNGTRYARVFSKAKAHHSKTI
jgi:hypothetical protein